MYCNIIYKKGEAFKILTKIKVHMFQDSNGGVNQQILGKYVHEWGGNKVLQKENDFLICKKIDEAIIMKL